MNEPSKRIQDLAQDFVAQLIEIAKAEVVHMLGGAGDLAAPSRRASPGTKARSTPSKSPGKGEKRSQADLDALQKRVLEFVRTHPGLRIEQINKEIGTKTKELQLPIRKLLAAKAIKATGEKRSTKYSAANGKK